MATKTWTYFPITSVLQKFEEILKPTDGWQAENDQQTVFLDEFHRPVANEVAAIPEIVSVADIDVNRVNQFLTERGFGDIKLEEIPDSLYAASVINLLVKWIKPGESGLVFAKDYKQYPGFSLGADAEIMDFRLVEMDNGCGQQKWILATIKTESGDEVNFLFPLEEDRNLSDDFIEKIGQAITIGGKPWKDLATRSVMDLVIPKIDLDQIVDISWLVDMRTADERGNGWFISQAKQQTKFRMDEMGARVESAAAASCTLECCPAFYSIDSPFFLWIERPGLSRPLFVSFLDYDCWKCPENLN